MFEYQFNETVFKDIIAMLELPVLYTWCIIIDYISIVDHWRDEVDSGWVL